MTVLEGGKGKRRAGAVKPKSLAQAIADGDKVAELKALKVLLGKRIEDPKTSAVAVAALTKQLREVGEQIAELEGKPAGGSSVEGGGSGDDGTPDDADWDDDI